MSEFWIAIGLGAIITYVASTVLFDGVHFLLHWMIRSPYPVLQKLGSLHQAHHEFWNSNLKFNLDWEKRDLMYHLVPEYLTSVMGSLLFLLVFPWQSVGLSVALLTLLFVVRCFSGGKDSNHKEMEILRAPRSSLFVGLRYHAHHHKYPNRYFSSLVTLFDRAVGTGIQLEGKRIVMTGSSGAFGKGLYALLQREKPLSIRTLKYGVDYRYGQYAGAREALAEADILILAHGAKGEDAFQANAVSFVALIELFRSLHRDRKDPVEVWAVGSEIESHPAFGAKEYFISKRAYAQVARTYYHDDSLVYRHIVPSAFTSPMGPGLISGRTAARIAMFFIKRGFRYVPVTYSGIAFLNLFKFIAKVNAKTPEAFLAEQALIVSEPGLSGEPRLLS